MLIAALANQAMQRTKPCSGMAVVGVLTWKFFSRHPLIAVVRTDTARDQCVDSIAFFMCAFSRWIVSLVVDCVPVA